MNKTENQLITVQDNLNNLLESKKEALPKAFNQTRFLQNCMVILQDTKDIEKVEPLSVARCMLKGAFLGLDFFNKECFAIPYGGKLQFQTGYKGEKKIAKKYSISPILEIYAKIVREGDELREYITNGEQRIDFHPVSFSSKKIIGAFAVVRYKDGSMIYDTMSTEEIEQTRKNYSKVPNGPGWVKSWGEMAKKTVLNRVSKLVDIEFESTEQQKVYVDSSDMDFSWAKNEKRPVPVTASGLDNLNDPEWTKPPKRLETKPAPKEEESDDQINAELEGLVNVEFDRQIAMSEQNGLFGHQPKTQGGK